MPRLAILLLTVALLAAAAGATYALRFNPEMDFWKEAATRKLAWADDMRTKHGRVIGVVGGSTTTFGIDAETLEREHGLPVANLGLHAGMGPEVCTGLGFAALQRGDTLIVSLEPSMLTDEESAPTGLGIRLAWVLRRPELLGWGNAPSPLWHLANPAKLQPGGYHAVTMLGKLVLNQPLYRYSTKDTRPGGLQTTTERRPLAAEPEQHGETGLQLSASGCTLLERIRDEAAMQGIHVAYILPWAYSPESDATRQRAENSHFLDQVAQYLPVIREPLLGARTDPRDFADSRQHLTTEAARERSHTLAESLQNLPGKPRQL